MGNSKKSPSKRAAPAKKRAANTSAATSNYPRQAVERALRIPRAILEQNAGKPCTIEESASFLGVSANGAYRVEASSALKYGFLSRPTTGKLEITDRAKRVLRPQDPQNRLDGLREAVLSAPVISEVYSHYRGENIPDAQFFHNALVDTFGVPSDKIAEFQEIFLDSLKSAELVSENDGKVRILDVFQGAGPSGDLSPSLRKLEKSVRVSPGDSCFVMMPFAAPLGDYYTKIYKPAIEKAGLVPVRADTEIFGTGKIIDQIWTGINAAKVLVAELTSRNPNVFYELGLAHALEKPVVLVSSNEDDVPFDLRHIRVIYYDVTDPFWGAKLLDKVAENLLSAIDHPEEAVLRRR